ncbi:MAG TPA: circadian clock protein KaiC [Bacteroidota bacterium]|nr:circadian clock protein KaiC [Bacteroidota bacterium]
MAQRRSQKRKGTGISKCPTGIRGLDEITDGGIPRGRPTLLCGSAGSGKTLLAMEILIRGAREFNEPGVFMAFEETQDELSENVDSLNFNLPSLIHDKKIAIDHVYIERSEFEETGDYDLEGIFIRLGSMIDEIGAKRVVLDTVEALFTGLPNEDILRSELRRLFRWLKAKGITTVITGEQGENTFTRHGLEEYVSDCVIFLDHRIINQVGTRRLRIVKYRGSHHGTNEYPALIGEHGFSVEPISAIGLSHTALHERISTGIRQLDGMMGGKGYFKGSTVLISGTAGSGKSSIAAAFADSICRQGKKCLYWSSEESPEQIVRNMSSIGIDLQQHVKKGLLLINSIRPTLFGLENHLVNLHRLVSEFNPEAVIMDPITNLEAIGNSNEIKAMLSRVIDFLKSRHITALFTGLNQDGTHAEELNVGVSSLMDTWILLSMVQSSNERNRVLYVLKSRGMSHSNQMREFILTDCGIDLVDVYTGSGTVYTGTARLTQEARDKADAERLRQSAEKTSRELDQERRMIASQIEILQTKLHTLTDELERATGNEKNRLEAHERFSSNLARVRNAGK